MPICQNTEIWKQQKDKILKDYAQNAMYKGQKKFFTIRCLFVQEWTFILNWLIESFKVDFFLLITILILAANFQKIKEVRINELPKGLVINNELDS